MSKGTKVFLNSVIVLLLLCLSVGYTLIFTDATGMAYQVGSGYGLLSFETAWAVKPDEDLTVWQSIDEWARREQALVIVSGASSFIHYYDDHSGILDPDGSTLYVTEGVSKDTAFFSDGRSTLFPEYGKVEIVDAQRLPNMLGSGGYLLPLDRSTEYGGILFTDGDINSLESVLKSLGLMTDIESDRNQAVFARVWNGIKSKSLAGRARSSLLIGVLFSLLFLQFILSKQYLILYSVEYVFGRTEASILVSEVLRGFLQGLSAFVLTMAINWCFCPSMPPELECVLIVHLALISAVIPLVLSLLSSAAIVYSLRRRQWGH